MKLSTSLLAILPALHVCLASPASSKRAAPISTQGVKDGFFYYFWSDAGESATYSNGDSGSYVVDWKNNQGSWVAGKGWSPGTTTRVASYEGTFEPQGNAKLSLNGFSRYVNYHVVESFGSVNPTSGNTIKGTITCNGSEYVVAEHQQSYPGQDGIYYDFYSVRNPPLPSGKVSGTIDFACHVAGWTKFGMNLTPEALEYQLLATEGYYSTGSAKITVS